MAASSFSPFATVIQSFILELKDKEDKQSPFYREVLAKASSTARSKKEIAWCAQELAEFVAELEQKQRRESKTLWVSEKLRPLLTGLNEYAQACDVIIQAAPSAAVLLYGGARVVLVLGNNITKAFDTVVKIMEQIGYLLKPYELFSQAYQSSADMHSLLMVSYKKIVRFWHKASKLLNQKKYKTLLVNVVKPLHVEWQKFSEDLQQDKDRIQLLAQATEASKTTQRDAAQTKRQIVDWIKSNEDDLKLDVRGDVDAGVKIRHEQSCEWFLELPDFRTWIESKKTSSIWYNAPPGTGKTVLMSTLTQHLQTKGLKTASFFYCFNDTVKKKPITALRCIALQLLKHAASIPDKVLRLYEDDVEDHCFKLRDWRVVEVCEALLQQIGRVHILVDGLDECEDRQELLNCFGRLLDAKTYGVVKWFFGSRPERDIRSCMQKHNVKTIKAPEDSLKSDITSFVRAQMESKSDHCCDKCVKYWTEASEGNFLWVTLMLHILLEGEGTVCDAEIEEELNKFPRGLSGCYMRGLAHLREKPERLQRLARRIFTMIVGAVQPLTLSELSQALASSSGGSHDYSAKHLPRTSDIEGICSNLIIFDRASGNESDPILRISHKSIFDFFQQDPSELGAPDDLHQYFVSSQTANLELGLSSLTYLNHSRYHHKQDISMLLDHPQHAFLKHAAIFWHWYLSHANHTNKISNDVVSFIKSPAFWTCTAVQSKLAPHLFARYIETDHGGFKPEATGPAAKMCGEKVNYANPLPTWLEDYSPEGPQLVQSFQNFVAEWHAVLNSHSLAFHHCTMDDSWDDIMPGWRVWATKRAKIHSLCPPESVEQKFEQLTVRDLRPGPVSSNLMSAVLFGVQLASSGIVPQWLRLDISPSAITPSAASKPTHPIAAGYPKGSEVFSREYAWGGPCSIVNTSNLYIENIQPNGEAPISFAAQGPTTRRLYEAMGGWRVLTKTAVHSKDDSVDEQAIAFHCISQNIEAAHKSMTEDSGLGSMSSSSNDGSEADVDSASVYSSDSEAEQDRDHCMIFLDGKNPPTYAFSKQRIERSEFKCAFHPNEQLAVWSCSMQELRITQLHSGLTELTVLPEPADVKTSSATAVRKEFHFSDSGQDLFYLLYVASETGTGIQQTVSITSFSFTADAEDGYLLSRTHPSHTLSYESSSFIDHPLILTSWSSRYLYVALPSLSCKPKVLRLRLPSGDYSEQLASSGFQTLRDPIFFPHSTSCRDPNLKVLESFLGQDQDILALTLDAQILSNEPGNDDRPSMRQLPAVMTWKIASQDDWREWNPTVDAQSEEFKAGSDQYKMLRGTYVATTQRFNVPIRSGLDWRKKAFLSCA